MIKSKYRNNRTILYGHSFDSAHEANRYLELKHMMSIGLIRGLHVQVPYILIPKQYDERGKLLERSCKYIADFVYEQDGKTVVEDAKGYRTPEYIIKRKLMLERYNIRIREV